MKWSLEWGRMKHGKRKKKYIYICIYTHISSRELCWTHPYLDRLLEWSLELHLDLTDFIPQIHRTIVFKSIGYFHSFSLPFFFFLPLIEFSSNFESGGEESALLVLFIMEIDLTLICIYLHRHQADLESEGGCNLLGSWQICSKNRALELSNQLWKTCSFALLISTQHGQRFREIKLVVKERKETFVASCYK